MKMYMADEFVALGGVYLNKQDHVVPNDDFISRSALLEHVFVTQDVDGQSMYVVDEGDIHNAPSVESQFSVLLEKRDEEIESLQRQLHNAKVLEKESVDALRNERRYRNHDEHMLKIGACQEFADLVIKDICEKVCAPTPSESYIVEKCNEIIQDRLKMMCEPFLEGKIQNAYERSAETERQPQDKEELELA